MVLNAIGLTLIVIGLGIIWGRWHYRDREEWLTYTRSEACLLAILLLVTASIGAWLSYEHGQDKAKIYVVQDDGRPTGD